MKCTCGKEMKELDEDDYAYNYKKKTGCIIEWCPKKLKWFICKGE